MTSESAAARIMSAYANHQPVSPVRDLLGGDIDLAYEVQELVLAGREVGTSRVGRKVGLTSPEVQKQLGVDQPDFGVLLADMEVPPGNEIPLNRLLQPRIEAEIAFILRSDLNFSDRDSVESAVEYAVAAFEIVDSRIAGWDISIVDTIADNASSGMFALGDKPLRLTEFDPISVRMSMTVEGETVSTGSGAACLGDPVVALMWVARAAIALGRPLQAGEVVLSGALGPMVSLEPGTRVRANLGPLGELTVTTSGRKGD